MPKLSILGLIGLTVIISGLAFAQEESISITTYYPAPYGVYREMRSKRMGIGENYYNNSNVCWGDVLTCPGGSTIIPDGDLDPDVDLVIEGNVGIGTASPGAKLEVTGSIKLSSDTPGCDVSNAGVIRWTGSDFEGCDGSAWVSLTSIGLDLVYGMHSSDQCTNLGGTVVTDGADKFCRFNQASCPFGWFEYENWSTTINNVRATLCGVAPHCRTSCICGAAICCGPWTGTHTWANIEPEVVTYTPVVPCAPSSATCSSTIVERGCY